jgi:hypothetical protein
MDLDDAYGRRPELVARSWLTKRETLGYGLPFISEVYIIHQGLSSFSKTHRSTAGLRSQKTKVELSRLVYFSKRFLATVRLPVSTSQLF